MPRSKAVAWGTLDPFHESGRVMGRTMANRSFLTALLERDPFDEYHFFLQTRGQCRSLRQFLEPLGLAGPRIRTFLRRELPRELARNAYHCFHLSDCMTAPAQLARLRNLCSQRIFPITSTTHSLSYHEYAARLLLHLWPGTTGRDCVVATSASGRRVMEQLYGLAEAGDAPREGGRPLLRQIPLGVDVRGYTVPTQEQRTRARAGLNVGHGETVLLAFGRISPHSKMDLLPLMRALQRVMRMKAVPDGVRLVVSGWAEQGDDLPQTLTEIARTIGLPLDLVLRPGEKDKKNLFRAADVFLSPADNPQETFGLTLLEAAAFGLPAIASDYDGYRELVEDGRTGFLVPTIGPSRTDLVDALAPLCGDGHAHLLLGQRTAVSVPELAGRICELIAAPGLRKSMGRAAREKVETQYSWEAVIDRHVRLWEELWSVPVPEGQADLRHPLEIPYARVFAHYPTFRLDAGTRLRWTLAGRALYRAQEHPLLYSGMEGVIDRDGLRVLLFLFRMPRTFGEAQEHMLQNDKRRSAEDVAAMVLWAVKQDLLEMA